MTGPNVRILQLTSCLVLRPTFAHWAFANEHQIGADVESELATSFGTSSNDIALFLACLLEGVSIIGQHIWFTDGWIVRQETYGDSQTKNISSIFS